MPIDVTPCVAASMPPYICLPSKFYGVKRGITGRLGYPIKAIVLHCLNMSLHAYDNHACTNRQLPVLSEHASLHFAINEEGIIHQYVDVADIAWAMQTYPGNFPSLTALPSPGSTTLYPGWTWTQVNPDGTIPSIAGKSLDAYAIHIGIAVEPAALEPSDRDCAPDCERPFRMKVHGYQRLIQMLRYLCDKYHIPMDRQHIALHEQIENLRNATETCDCVLEECISCDVDAYCELCNNPRDSSFQLGQVIKYLYGENETGCKVKISVADLKLLMA